MEQNTQHSSTDSSQETTNDTSTFGTRDAKGEWRPPYPCSYAPLFEWPLKPGRIFSWLFGYPGYLWPINALFIALAVVTWVFLQPEPARCVELKAGWIALLFLRNMILIWLVYGGFHLALYTLKLHGSERKYHPKWQIVGEARYLFRNQVFDNVFFACVFGCPIWTAYEVLYTWAAANQWVPYLGFKEHPVWFVALFLLIPLWREIHFYAIHRLIHWKPLLKAIHSVHHKNPNPGPWAGLAMHPVEHLLYFSVVLIHFIVPSHPIHFLFNSQLTALTPAQGHHGFEGPLFDGKLPSGSYFHYLHHRYVSCNFGESTIPLDRWFGSFHDGDGPYRKNKAAKS